MESKKNCLFTELMGHIDDSEHISIIAKELKETSKQIQLGLKNSLTVKVKTASKDLIVQVLPSWHVSQDFSGVPLFEKVSYSCLEELKSDLDKYARINCKAFIDD